MGCHWYRRSGGWAAEFEFAPNLPLIIARCNDGTKSRWTVFHYPVKLTTDSHRQSNPIQMEATINRSSNPENHLYYP